MVWRASLIPGSRNAPGGPHEARLSLRASPSGGRWDRENTGIVLHTNGRITFNKDVTGGKTALCTLWTYLSKNILRQDKNKFGQLIDASF